MKFQIMIIAAALAAVACATPGFSGSANVAGGTSIELSAQMPTLEACAASVRAAAVAADPTSLGQVIPGGHANLGEAVGICGGPDGRMYFITPTAIQPGPAVVFER